MRTASFVVVAAMFATGLNAQSVISAHSGVLHYYEGDVTVNGQTPHQRTGTFAEVKENQELQTQAGRAEVLLTPGVFLRVGENSAIRMNSNKLTDTRVEFVEGSAILDFVEVAKDNQVTVNYQDYTVSFAKKGIYRFDSAPAEFKVYTGEATVSHGAERVNLKDGRAVPFTPALVSEKFDNRTGDELYRWAKRRSEYIAVANLSAARQAGTSYNSGGTGTGGWYYNPYYSMFTFMPGRGYMCDPFSTFMMSPFYSPSFFGCYYSPLSAWNYFSRPGYGYGYGYGGYGGGYYGGGGGGRGYGYGRGGGGYSPVANHYPTSIGTSRALSSHGSSLSSPSASSASSVSGVGSSSSSGFSGASSGFSGSSSPGFSGGGASHSGGFSGGGGGSHGGGGGGHR